MKKLALALLLLVVLIGVSYLNAIRSDEKLKKQYAEGYERGAKQSQEATQRADSLSAFTEQVKATYQDSLSGLTTAHQASSDSLKQVILQKDQEIAGLRQKTKAASRPTKTARKSDSSQVSAKHAQILDYYKRRLNDLPKDLSEYERKVALAELRDETARKYSITVGEFDKIRQTQPAKD